MRTTSPPVSSLATELRLAVARTARRMRQEAGADLTPTLASALATLDRHGPLTPSDLAARERIQRPTATRLIARLESAGLVARRDVPDDGRSVLIERTQEGRRLLEELRGRKSQFLARRLELLDEGDRATLARAAELLEQLISGE